MPTLTCDVILLGAGKGSRFATSTSGSKVESEKSLPKQFCVFEDAPVFVHPLRAFIQTGYFRRFVIAVSKEHIALTNRILDEEFGPSIRKNIFVVEGGDRRQDSSRLALRALDEAGAPERVVIHDACRPFLAPAFMDRILGAARDRSYGAWIPVIPIVDTLKRIKDSEIIETVDRSALQRVQTPQVFEFSVIRSLAEKATGSPDLTVTDDAALCEYYGIPVRAFDGEPRNIKLTYDFEMETLRPIMKEMGSIQKCESESATTFTA